MSGLKNLVSLSENTVTHGSGAAPIDAFVGHKVLRHWSFWRSHVCLLGAKLAAGLMNWQRTLYIYLDREGLASLAPHPLLME